MFSYNDFINNNPKWIKKEENFIIDQNKREQDYYFQTKKTNINEFDKQLISNVNEKELTKLVLEKNYNYDIMKIFARYVNLLIYLSNEEPGVRDFFKNNRKIGKETSEGIVFKSNLKDIKNMFIVKIPQKDKKENLFHEFFVGSHLNILRKEIMNFAYIYGSFDCNFPILSDHHIYNICSSNKQVINYLIEENIKDNISCEKLFPYLDDVKELILIYLQIFLAISYANDILGFTHYDLHIGNVLIKKYSESIIIPYPFIENGNKRYIYIKTQYVPFIVDYGFSHIEINDFNYSLDGGIYFGDVNYGISNPLIDFFHFIASSIFIINEDCYDEGINKLLGYFISDIEQEINEELFAKIENIYEHTHLSFPGNKRDDGKEFIHFILDNFKYPEISDKYDNSAQLLSCLNSDCKNEKDILNKILNDFNPINIFYEIYNEIKEEKYNIKEIKEMFHSSENGYLESINQDIIEFNLLSQKYNEEETQIYELIDKNDKIYYNLSIYMKICKIIGENLFSNFSNIMNIINNIKNILENKLKMI